MFTLSPGNNNVWFQIRFSKCVAFCRFLPLNTLVDIIGALSCALALITLFAVYYHKYAVSHARWLWQAAAVCSCAGCTSLSRVSPAASAQPIKWAKPMPFTWRTLIGWRRTPSWRQCWRGSTSTNRRCRSRIFVRNSSRWRQNYRNANVASASSSNHKLQLIATPAIRLFDRQCYNQVHEKMIFI